MSGLSDYSQNFLTDALFRGGALNAAGTVNSTATVKGIWTATTAYVLGDTVVPHASMTGAGGKFLRCTTAGTSGSTNTLAVPAVGSTLADGSVTWTAVSGVPCPSGLFFAMLTCTKGGRLNSTAYSLNDTVAVTANDGKVHLYKVTTAGTTAAAQSTLYPGAVGEAITDGTAVFTEQSAAIDANTVVEATGGSYARAPLAASLANYAGTQAAASTTASTGTGGTTSNNGVVTWPTPTGQWVPAGGAVWAVAVYDQLTGGNLLQWAPVSALKTSINTGDPAPTAAAAALTFSLGS
ncbi:hypothetical protein J7E70_02180 [Variovorax paradoxus]|nr:hypothetical protein [Variovorax paradoxus]MBT2299261.1 hypothetical protein [Variovorax paradoxus]